MRPVKNKLMSYRPNPGYAWNPATKYPPNKPCFCGSLIKAKKCCLPGIPKIIPEGQVLEVKAFIAKVEAM